MSLRGFTLAWISLALSACQSSSPRPPQAPAYPVYAAPSPGYAPPPGYAASPNYGTQANPGQFPAREPVPGYPQYPAPAPSYAPASYPPAATRQPYPAQPYPTQPSPPPLAMPAGTTPVALPDVTSDPINDVNMPWLHQESLAVLAELTAALPDDARARVQGIPLVVDDSAGEINAFAACSDSGKPAMAITDGLLEVSAWLAMSTAHDELFGTRKADEYVQFIASHLQSGKPIPRPNGFFTPAAQLDARKVRRQHDVFDEEVAFILGHELSHHHLGHLPCTGKPGPLGAADLWRTATSQVALFNQPNEAAADLAGTTNVLDAGKRRSGSHWTENGGLITMRFFLGLEGDGGLNVLAAFQRSHPSPRVRIPLIQESASFWRQSGGIGIPVPRLGG